MHEALSYFSLAQKMRRAKIPLEKLGDSEACDDGVRVAGTHFTCFPSTKVQILLEKLGDSEACDDGVRVAGSHFTCFPSTKVQILTREEFQ